jgi:hypothetical protein
MNPPEIDQEAREILSAEGLVARVEADLGRAGIVGETDLRLTLYFVATSRLLADPLHAIVQGESSSGKTFVVERIAKLLPEDHLVRATHMSPKALYYLSDLKHRFLVLGERARTEGPEIEDSTKALRELRSSGRLRAQVVGPNGKLLTLDAEGPVASVETTTKETLFGEDANRCLLLSTEETEAQTRNILFAQAAAALGGETSDREDLFALHHAMQVALAEGAPHRVQIPFAWNLAARFPASRTEARRAHRMLLGLVEAIALLHRFQRALADGRIVATVEDYALARRLLAKPLASSIGGALPDRIVRFFQEITEHYRAGDTFASVDLAAKLDIRPQRAGECLRALRDSGSVRLTERAKGPNPATWELVSSTLPEATFGLPEPEELR